MDDPKEIWVFDRCSPKVIGPCKIVGKGISMDCLYYKHGGSAFIHMIPENEAILTKKLAAKACYKYHNKRIKQLRKELDKQKRILGKFYLEEVYE